jgi:hypothetical protein
MLELVRSVAHTCRQESSALSRFMEHVGDLEEVLDAKEHIGAVVHIVLGASQVHPLYLNSVKHMLFYLMLNTPYYHASLLAMCTYHQSQKTESHTQST